MVTPFSFGVFDFFGTRGTSGSRSSGSEGTISRMAARGFLVEGGLLFSAPFLDLEAFCFLQLSLRGEALYLQNIRRTC